MPGFFMKKWRHERKDGRAKARSQVRHDAAGAVSARRRRAVGRRIALRCGVDLRREQSLRDDPDVCPGQGDSRQRIARLQTAIGSRGALWVAYVKGTSALKSDINRDSIREYVATVGLDTVAQIAIDHDWSALRLKAV
jgi:hypothetical protein